MVKLNQKIKGSTLIEVIVALLIILIVYGILTFFIQKLGKQLKHNKEKSNAYFVIEKTINETKQNNLYYNDEFVTNDIKFVKEVTNYKEYKNIYNLRISAFNKNNVLLVEIKEIIDAER